MLRKLGYRCSDHDWTYFIHTNYYTLIYKVRKVKINLNIFKHLVITNPAYSQDHIKTPENFILTLQFVQVELFHVAFQTAIVHFPPCQLNSNPNTHQAKAKYHHIIIQSKTTFSTCTSDLRICISQYNIKSGNICFNPFIACC